MDVSEIKFCNKGAFNIKNNREKSNIIQYIHDRYNVSINKQTFHFYNDRYLQNMKQEDYFVNTLTQGAEYWLFLTRIHNENYSLFIDKKRQENHPYPKIILSTFRFKDHLYNDTLFNGELVRSYKGNWEFLIDDLIVYNKKRYQKSTMDKIRKLHDILKNEYIFDNVIQLCPLKVKRFFTYEDLRFVINNFIPTCNYNIIGLSFVPFLYREHSIRFYFKLDTYTKKEHIHYIESINSLEASIQLEQELLKQTENDNVYLPMNVSYDMNQPKQLFTFKMKSTKLPNIYDLYILDNNQLLKHSIAKIDTLECAEYMRCLYKQKNEYVMDCYYNKTFSKWTPVDVSKKKHPSNYIDINTFLKSI